jgi:hypothetical protein
MGCYSENTERFREREKGERPTKGALKAYY